MGNLLEYSGIITKLRAMEARLLTDEQFEEISALTSVTELVSYLNTNSSYQDVLQDMDETMLHRGNIEKVLVTFDGATSVPIQTGDKLTICKAEKTTKIMKINKISFLEILRRKMKGN